MIIIVMGVSGCGKTTIGQQLSRRLTIPFFDADDFHPEENVKKMAAGIPLTDEDRLPWLRTLAGLLQENKDKGCVLGCSALKEKYRQILSAGREDLLWVLLHGDMKVIQERMMSRKDHFMPLTLLASQLATLEEPEYALKVDITKAPELIVNQILDNLPPNETTS